MPALPGRWRWRGWTRKVTWLADCAPGETGHLLINGPNVFAGYADAAQTAAAAFAAPGWLDTGDLGHCDVDGYFWISGRAKDLIGRSGHSIDPQGVEEAPACRPRHRHGGGDGLPRRPSQRSARSLSSA